MKPAQILSTTPSSLVIAYLTVLVVSYDLMQALVRPLRLALRLRQRARVRSGCGASNQRRPCET